MNTAIWQRRVHTGAFLLSICCVLAFLAFAFVPGKTGPIFSLHPLMINLWLAVFNFFLGVIGFSEVTNGKRFAMSIATLLITLLLSVLLLYILAVGKLLS